MTWLQSVVLGAIQGLTEFLPISSTAHLRIVPALAGWRDPGAAFTAVTQLGTMAAVLLYFRADIWRIALAWSRSLSGSHQVGPDARLGWMILLGTIPIGVAGLAFQDQIETSARDLRLIAVMLIVAGLVLAVAERVGRRDRPLPEIRGRDGAVVGFAQALALIPGVSRSGATISAGLFLGLDRVAAARFSFLLSVPAVVLSGLFELKGLIDGSTHGDGAAVELVAVATLIAFVVGYASIALLLRFLVSHSTLVFVGYRLILGSLVLVLSAGGQIH